MMELKLNAVQSKAMLFCYVKRILLKNIFLQSKYYDLIYKKVIQTLVKVSEVYVIRSSLKIELYWYKNLWMDLNKVSSLGENSHTLNFFSTCNTCPHQKKSCDVVRIIDLLMTLMTSVRGVHYIRTVMPILGHGSVKISSFWCKWPPAPGGDTPYRLCPKLWYSSNQ